MAMTSFVKASGQIVSGLDEDLMRKDMNETAAEAINLDVNRLGARVLLVASGVAHGIVNDMDPAEFTTFAIVLGRTAMSEPIAVSSFIS